MRDSINASETDKKIQPPSVKAHADDLPLLSEVNAAFVQRFTSMNVAGRDALHRPALARGLGIRVSPDRRTLTVFLSETHSSRVLACLRENGAIALAVTRPKTHQTLQFKGQVREVGPLSDEDRREMVAYQESFVAELEQLAYSAEFTRQLLAGSESAVAVVFEPEAMFDQTPGPNAGEKLGSKS
ncbi:hypothetical protein [Rhodoferax sp.]|uniref:hypothetical protein n=1 Tax=Rhodoferax sp. TaxID=50421 RepID=UPI00271BD069|nr:hypothetical protein [Rhodoferax sp.]MDO9142741.1 hypothetical protein [Rhodoferax sp.]MDP1529672.1 hypothetical protein [Rhodoferax sp.]MDP1945349.1 hypothetical protein [Rhodoferax sp.]MDP2441432.1 hypothetical protein [Rhodoferax sp.]MDP3191809.1 hypothetical protein [Rhodoferax sp.]